MMTICNDIVRTIQTADSILITSHEDPDGDSLGSQLAMRGFVASYGKSAVIVNQGKIPFKYLFLPDIDKITPVEDYKSTGAFDLAIILECPGLERTGKVSNLISDRTKIINIDHHPDNSGFGNVVLVEPKASSVGEMLFALISEAGVSVNKKMTIQLYAAILTDTGRFRFGSTTRRTMEIAGQLIELGANPREICDKIYYSFPPSTMKLTGKVLSGISFFDEGKICLLQLDQKALKESEASLGDVDGLADYTLYGGSVLVGALLKEINGTVTKVSLRSRDQIDVSRLAHKYGGGGHFNAAGFAINLPLKQAGEKLLEDLRGIVNG